MSCCDLASGIPPFPLGGSYNFSFHEIYFDTIIRQHQQMIVAEQIDIFEGKQLDIVGQLVLIP